MPEPKIPFSVGDRSVFSKTITETDVYLFAGISGDMNPVHVNASYMANTDMKRCIAHGLLVFAIASGTEYIFLSHSPKAPELEACGLTYLSYGYDKVRFLKPVYYGDTMTAVYEITSVDDEAMKSTASLTVTNQAGELVFVATHILKFFPK